MKKAILRLYGPFNSGTNLTCSLLSYITKNNFINDTKSKHTLDWNAIKRFLRSNSNNCVVFMYRPILSWLKSMKKESYTLNYKNIYMCKK